MHKYRMTIISLAVCVLLVASAAVTSILAEPKKTIHPITGVWTNPDYNGEGRSARVSYQPKGKDTYLYTAFDNADGSGAVYKGTVVLKKTWQDAKGYSYGLSTVTLTEFGMSWETMDRISPDGKTLEVQPGVTEINPKGPRYSVYKKLK